MNNHLRKNWLTQTRQRAPGAEPKVALESIEIQLLIVLIHCRRYPIQEVLGFLFGMKQPQADCWIMRLTPLLKKALGWELVLPVRQPYRLEQVLSECPELQFVIDATDRPIIRRPKDK